MGRRVEGLGLSRSGWQARGFLVLSSARCYGAQMIQSALSARGRCSLDANAVRIVPIEDRTYDGK